MTKQDELHVLNKAIAELGPDSYLGPWLLEVQNEVGQLIQSDFPVEISVIAASKEAARLVADATEQAKQLRENAEREATRRIEKRHAAVEDPAVNAVVTAEPVLHLKHLAPLKGVQINLQTALHIICEDALGPAVTQLLLQAPPGKGKPLLIKIVALGLRIRPPNHDGRLLDQDPVLVKRQAVRHVAPPFSFRLLPSSAPHREEGPAFKTDF